MLIDYMFSEKLAETKMEREDHHKKKPFFLDFLFTFNFSKYSSSGEWYVQHEMQHNTYTTTVNWTTPY